MRMHTAKRLAMGYTDQIDLYRGDSQIGTFTRLTLRKEHNAYHVVAYEYYGRGRLAWEVYGTLAQARSLFKQLHREIKRGVV